jgi:beta-1,2-xylosyltransferase
MDKDTPWEKSHRFRLHNFAQNASEAETTFMVPDIGTEGGPLRMKKETGPTGNLSAFFYDMKLAGEPLQCNETDGTCNDME